MYTMCVNACGTSAHIQYMFWKYQTYRCEMWNLYIWQPPLWYSPPLSHRRGPATCEDLICQTCMLAAYHQCTTFMVPSRPRHPTPGHGSKLHPTYSSLLLPKISLERSLRPTAWAAADSAASLATWRWCLRSHREVTRCSKWLRTSWTNSKKSCMNSTWI